MAIWTHSGDAAPPVAIASPQAPAVNRSAVVAGFFWTQSDTLLTTLPRVSPGVAYASGEVAALLSDHLACLVQPVADPAYGVAHAATRIEYAAVPARVDRVDRVVGRIEVGVDRLAIGCGDAPGVALQEGADRGLVGAGPEELQSRLGMGPLAAEADLVGKVPVEARWSRRHCRRRWRGWPRWSR